MILCHLFDYGIWNIRSIIYGYNNNINNDDDHEDHDGYDDDDGNDDDDVDYDDDDDDDLDNVYKVTKIMFSAKINLNFKMLKILITYFTLIFINL